eukprot:COSAG06_NODE_1763_length_8449_cov_184.922275_3_plen_56_part_00
MGEKNVLFEPFIYKTIFLPRQARDTHRENSKKNGVSLGAAVLSLRSLLSGTNDRR